MSDYDTLDVEHDPRGFTTLWLNRPEKHNAFDAALIADLTQALRQVAASPATRLLIVRGRGKHFCAGADLAWMQASAQLSLQANLDDAHALAELMYTLDGLAIPTLAVVQGVAFGGAVGLVACCDAALGAQEAVFCLSEVRVGLVPAVISPFVVRALGPRKARRYMLSAERFNGTHALAMGLLDEVAPLDELDARVDAWVVNHLRNSPAALRACKQLLREVGDGQPTAQVRAYTEQAIARLRTSAEGQEGLRAFLEKRAPAWQQEACP